MESPQACVWPENTATENYDKYYESTTVMINQQLKGRLDFTVLHHLSIISG